MKVFTFLFAILFFPAVSFAEDLDNKINKTCLRHAVSLVAKLKTEIIGDLSEEKSEQALKLTTDSCQVYFKKEFGQDTPESISVKSDPEKEEGKIKDWLTEKILSGDVSRKKGNERLKNLKH